MTKSSRQNRIDLARKTEVAINETSSDYFGILIEQVSKYLIESDFVAWIKSRKNIHLHNLTQEEFNKEFFAYVEKRFEEIERFYYNLENENEEVH